MARAPQITVGVDANVRIRVEDAASGLLVAEHERHNLFVTAGRNVLRDLLAGTLASVPAGSASHLAVGTNGTAVAATDTALGGEVFRDAITSITQASGQIIVDYFLSSASANGSTLREAGLFTSAAGGTMLARVATDPIVKTSSLQVTYSWTIQITAA